MEMITAEEILNEYVSIYNSSCGNEGTEYFSALISAAEINRITAENIYDLCVRYGLPLEFVIHIAERYGMYAETEKYRSLLKDSSNAFKRNKAAAEMLISAFQNVLGNEIKTERQRIDGKKAVIDICYDKPFYPEQLRQAENIVNEKLLSDKSGENNFVGLVRIMSEKSAGSGVRRIEAVSGSNVTELIDRYEKITSETMTAMHIDQPEHLPAAASKLNSKLKEYRSTINMLTERLAVLNAQSAMENIITANGIKTASVIFENTDAAVLRETGKILAKEDIFSVCIGLENGKTHVCVCCGKNAKNAGLDAGIIIRSLPELKDCKGGGNSLLYLVTRNVKVNAEKLADELIQTGLCILSEKIHPPICNN